MIIDPQKTVADDDFGDNDDDYSDDDHAASNADNALVMDDPVDLSLT